MWHTKGRPCEAMYGVLFGSPIWTPKSHPIHRLKDDLWKSGVRLLYASSKSDWYSNFESVTCIEQCRGGGGGGGGGSKLGRMGETN